MHHAIRKGGLVAAGAAALSLPGAAAGAEAAPPVRMPHPPQAPRTQHPDQDDEWSVVESPLFKNRPLEKEEVDAACENLLDILGAKKPSAESSDEELTLTESRHEFASSFFLSANASSSASAPTQTMAPVVTLPEFMRSVQPFIVDCALDADVQSSILRVFERKRLERSPECVEPSLTAADLTISRRSLHPLLTPSLPPSAQSAKPQSPAAPQALGAYVTCAIGADDDAAPPQTRPSRRAAGGGDSAGAALASLAGHLGAALAGCARAAQQAVESAFAPLISALEKILPAPPHQRPSPPRAHPAADEAREARPEQTGRNDFHRVQGGGPFEPDEEDEPLVRLLLSVDEGPELPERTTPVAVALLATRAQKLLHFPDFRRGGFRPEGAPRAAASQPAARGPPPSRGGGGGCPFGIHEADEGGLLGGAVERAAVVAAATVMVLVLVLLGRAGFAVKAGRGAATVVRACAMAAAAATAAKAAAMA